MDTRGQGIMEDLNGVVRGSSARVRVVGDDAGEAEAAEVEAEPFVVIFSQKFCVDFGHSVDSFRSLDAQVWCRISRRLGTKGSNCTGYKKFQFI